MGSSTVGRADELTVFADRRGSSRARGGAETAGRASGEPAKWSARKTLGFIVLTCGAFWTLVVWAVMALLK